MTKAEWCGARRGKIRLVLVMDDEPFYLAQALRYFLPRLSNEYDVVSAVVLTSHYQRWNRGQWIRARHIVKVFGLRIFVRIVSRFVVGRMMRSRRAAAAVKEHGIPVLTRVKDVNAAETIQHLAQCDPDLIVAIGVNSLFRKRLRDLARLGCVNVHTGIKPEHRGRAAIFWALADGDQETGVTVHYIDGGVDSGRTIATSRYRITDRSFERLLRDLRMQSMDTLLEALSILRDGTDQKKEEARPTRIGFRPQPDVQDMMAFARAGNRIF